MKRLLLGFVAFLLAVPVALVGTFLLTPLWRWIEASTSIESIGHSGPADWCFIAVYGLTFLAILGIWHRVTKRVKNGDRGPADSD